MCTLSAKDLRFKIFPFLVLVSSDELRRRATCPMDLRSTHTTKLSSDELCRCRGSTKIGTLLAMLCRATMLTKTTDKHNFTEFQTYICNFLLSSKAD